MSSEQQNRVDRIELPESLWTQIHAFEKRLRVAETVIAVTGGLCGFLVTYLVLFLSDRLWDTPPALRAPLTSLGGLCVGGFALFWARHWLWRRRDVRELAKLIQRKHRKLGDRLLGIVELADGRDLPGNISPALCRAAIRQVAAESETIDFRQAVAKKRPRRFSLAFVALALICAVPVVVFPRAGLNTLLRWTRPLSPVTRYTFVKLDDLPDELIVAHGEPFNIECAVDKSSQWTPTTAHCRFENQPPLTATVRKGVARFEIPGQTTEGNLELRIGDVTKRVTVRPVFRPELRSVVGLVTYPDYLQRPLSRQRVENGSLDVVAGSRFRLRLEAERPLESATMAEGEHMYDLAVSNRVMMTAALPTRKEGRYSFEWKDRFNLLSAAPYLLDVTVNPDKAPAIHCSGLARSVAILEDEVVELDLGVEDDFGVRECWVTWKHGGKQDEGIAGEDGRKTIGEGGPQTQSIEGTFSFSPVTHHVPEEATVTLQAFASDYHPTREPAQSPVFKIYVLSRAQHARIVQEQMEAIQARIEELAREEERLIEANRELEKLDENALRSDKTSAQLAKHEQAENSNRRQLEQLSREAENLTREALRNKNISEKTLANWLEMAQNMKQTAQGDMKQASQSLQQAKSDPQERKEDIEEAIAAEERALEAMREMESGINQSIENMLAQNFINRLREAARHEQEIADGVREILSQIVGLPADELPEKPRETLDMAARRQDFTRERVSYIQDDLSGFYNRTREEVYNQIFSGMKQTNIVSRLGALAKAIRRNEGARAIQEAMHWKTKLEEWAAMLEKQNQQGGGEGGGDGEGEPVDIETLLALMRLRMRQESIREQTRLLEQGRDENRVYRADARKLSRKQDDLADDARPLERRVESDKVRLFIEKIGGEMMNSGMYLKRPQTDKETIAIQTEIIELLAQALSSAASSSSGSAAEAAAMMEAMGMGSSQQGGGSDQGGSTDRANDAAAGNAAGNSGGERDVDKAGGLDTRRLPAEFRDAIEAYFNAVEESP